jgi:hypothetical protein
MISMNGKPGMKPSLFISMLLLVLLFILSLLSIGSCAGIMEHVGMFPLDTVKVSLNLYYFTNTIIDSFISKWRKFRLP